MTGIIPSHIERQMARKLREIKAMVVWCNRSSQPPALYLFPALSIRGELKNNLVKYGFITSAEEKLVTGTIVGSPTHYSATGLKLSQAEQFLQSFSDVPVLGDPKKGLFDNKIIEGLHQAQCTDNQVILANKPIPGTRR